MSLFSPHKNPSLFFSLSLFDVDDTIRAESQKATFRMHDDDTQSSFFFFRADRRSKRAFATIIIIE